MRGVAAAVLIAVAGCSSPPPSEGSSEIAAFARNDLGLTEFRSAQADLNGDGQKEALVYATDQNWCGTGGCTLFVLSPAGSTYRIVGRTPATNLPVRLLDASHNGWRDIAVTVRARALEGRHAVRLPFNGTAYPRSAFGPEATALKPVEGQILLATSGL